jgi:hypothetical protein
VSALRNLQVPKNVGNFLTSCKPVSFSRGTLLHGVSKYYNPGENLLNQDVRMQKIIITILYDNNCDTVLA